MSIKYSQFLTSWPTLLDILPYVSASICPPYPVLKWCILGYNSTISRKNNLFPPELYFPNQLQMHLSICISRFIL
jgi:hypothetical protein